MSDKKIKFVDGQMYEYEIYNLVDCYDPILSEKLEPFDFNNPPVVPRYLAVSLIETMVANRGVGLAANQVGLPYRVLVMGAENVGFACFNPEILSVEREETVQESCLSFQGLFLKVKRPYRIEVKYTDMAGVTQQRFFEGLTARIFQHELDHLNGVKFTSLVGPAALDIAKQKVKKNLKKMVGVVSY
jgi:peptide deformylase